MASYTITASAPGSLMLMGEHAVLHGHLSLVAAVNRRIRVFVTPRTDRQVVIESDLGRYESSLDTLEPSSIFRFLIVLLRHTPLKVGVDIRVVSEFSHSIGFGSSAAVTVAATAALKQLLNGSMDEENVFDHAVRIIREVQGMGSGADVAASTFGRVVMYRAEPREIEVLGHTNVLTAVYSGSKMPTPEVVALVEERRKLYPGIYGQIFEAIDQCVMDAADAIQMQDWPTVGHMMNINHGLMDAIGVNNEALSNIVFALRADPGILGAKISGSGLGDCAIGLGAVRSIRFPHDIIPVEIDSKGVTIEEA